MKKNCIRWSGSVQYTFNKKTNHSSKTTLLLINFSQYTEHNIPKLLRIFKAIRLSSRSRIRPTINSYFFLWFTRISQRESRSQERHLLLLSLTFGLGLLIQWSKMWEGNSWLTSIPRENRRDAPRWSFPTALPKTFTFLRLKRFY